MKKEFDKVRTSLAEAVKAMEAITSNPSEFRRSNADGRKGRTIGAIKRLKRDIKKRISRIDPNTDLKPWQKELARKREEDAKKAATAAPVEGEAAKKGAYFMTDGGEVFRVEKGQPMPEGEGLTKITKAQFDAAVSEGATEIANPAAPVEGDE